MTTSPTATVYHDEDADLGALATETVAVVGYGNQGRSQALNLRDSGLRVIVGNIGDEARTRASDDGFEAYDVADAVRRADVVVLLVPDEVMPEVYDRDVAPHLCDGACVCVASGYTIAFGHVVPAASVDVVLVAPRMIGPGVRDRYVAGKGFPSFVGVHQDATGRAKSRMLALARGIGSTRAGCLELTMAQEAHLDLFTEQGFGPMMGLALRQSIELLVEQGYPAEAVVMELYASGELGYAFERAADTGLFAQNAFHSHTSQYGSMTRSARVADIDLKPRMLEHLDDIRSGRFASEWRAEQKQGLPLYTQLKEMARHHPLFLWEQRTRTAFRMD
ncbi:MAG: ketol-acid reductoisomerase [Candidatus Binatia bacterium]